MTKHHEFWHPRLFEAPFYAYLAWQCARNRLGVRDLAKANYALDHGEIGMGSKFHTQHQFAQTRFPATQMLGRELTPSQRLSLIAEFSRSHGLPVILKPDIGLVGKGILKIHTMQEAQQRVAELAGDYLLQQYCDLTEEYGVFYIRMGGVSRISGINQKHFPEVVGNGTASLVTLARAHPRYSQHWSTFLQYHELERVPYDGEVVKLSFIGSHTMGCMFTDDSSLLSAALEDEIFNVCDPQPGFNFGRLDVKAQSRAALQDGDFTIIEINGISSLPTHMFDPKYSLGQAYAIFFEHGKFLARTAREHRAQAMALMPLWQLAGKIRQNQAELDRLHHKLKPDETGVQS